jgi:hypothetical protein
VTFHNNRKTTVADLDNILSGNSTAAPETHEQETVTQVDTGESQQQQTEAEGAEGERGTKMVPHEALHAEKQKVKRYTEQVGDFQRQLSETNANWERRMTQLVEAVRPKQEAAPPPDFFENPALATRHEVQQSVSPQFEQINQQLLAIARDNAETRFTPETVNEAEQAFISALQSQKLDPADYQKVVSSPNRYAAAVQWHKRQIAQAEIGDDPSAFKAKLEAELREKITAELQGEQPAQQQRQPVMPSNLAGARNVGSRSGPAWSGPTALNDIFNRAPPSG